MQTGMEEMGQKTQGCFKVFLTNEDASELSCSCICMLVLEVSMASVAGKLLWVSSGVFWKCHHRAFWPQGILTVVERRDCRAAVRVWVEIRMPELSQGLLAMRMPRPLLLWVPDVASSAEPSRHIIQTDSCWLSSHGRAVPTLHNSRFFS